MIKSILKRIPPKQFFKNNKLLTLGIILLISSLAIAGGTVIFNAGTIQTTVTVQDNPAPTYDVLIDGVQCPTTISESLTMGVSDTLQVQYNIKNNEGFSVNALSTVTNSDTGLTVTLYDGTLTATDTITIPANSNKWLVVEYATDNTVSDGDTLTADIEIKIIPTS